MKAFSLILVFATLSCFCGAGQVTNVPGNVLHLTDSSGSIENTIHITLSTREYESIQSITGEKTPIKTSNLVINGDTLIPEEINTRGQTTLYFKRKSFSVKLNSGAIFRHGQRSEKLKKFDVISLSMDKYYTRNRLAFGMMGELELFGLFYTFCDLRINGRSEGIYMILERPDDWAEHKNKSPLVLRRGYDHKIEKIDLGKGIDKNEKKKDIGNFNQIYKAVNKYEGEELYRALSQWMDLGNYMKWLAFNFLIHNGDYSDEVFFYVDPADGKFRIIPWDYDDLFSMEPHEGKEARQQSIGDKLIFSSEDRLDVKIAKDPYLYRIYLSVFREVLTKLEPAILANIFEDTYAELYPYYTVNEIISNSQFDYYKNANLATLKYDMLSNYQFLMNSIIGYLDNLKKKQP